MSSLYFNALPDFYVTPSFPSLYWPFRASAGEAKYLDSFTDMWEFTLYWTLITIPTAHSLVALWASLMQFVSAVQRRRHLQDPEVAARLSAKNRRLLGENTVATALRTSGITLAIYMVVGGIEALMAGSVVGVVLGAIYSAGYFSMSTWTPFLWSIINMLVLILASFRIQGGL